MFTIDLPAADPPTAPVQTPPTAGSGNGKTEALPAVVVV